MADYNDMRDSQVTKWRQLFDQSGATGLIAYDPERFPEGYHNDVMVSMGLVPSANGANDLLKELSEQHPKTAVVQLMFYSVYFVLRQNPVEFISSPELTYEFRDLTTQAQMLRLTPPPSFLKL